MSVSKASITLADLANDSLKKNKTKGLLDLCIIATTFAKSQNKRKPL